MLNVRTPRTYRITPSLADRYHRCPRSAALAAPFAPTAASERGERIHRVVERWAGGHLAGRATTTTDLLIAAGIAPGSDEAEAAETSLAYVQEWQRSTGAEIVAAERYILTPPRPLLGQEGLLVELSGRIDLVARRERVLYVVDLKTSEVVPTADDWAGQPSPAIYTMLAQRERRAADRIVVVYLYPLQGQAVIVHLNEEQLEAGRAVVRRIVGLLAEGSAAQVATPGRHCAWCEARPGCPAHPTDDGDDQPF